MASVDGENNHEDGVSSLFDDESMATFGGIEDVDGTNGGESENVFM